MRKDNANVTVNPFEIARVRIEYLKELYDNLLVSRRSYTHTYERIGEHQRSDWRTGELLYNEDGTPKMENDFDYVPKDELDDDDKLRIGVIDDLLNELTKLM